MLRATTRSYASTSLLTTSTFTPTCMEHHHAPSSSKTGLLLIRIHPRPSQRVWPRSKLFRILLMAWRTLVNCLNHCTPRLPKSQSAGLEPGVVEGQQQLPSTPDQVKSRRPPSPANHLPVAPSWSGGSATGTATCHSNWLSEWLWSMAFPCRSRAHRPQSRSTVRDGPESPLVVRRRRTPPTESPRLQV